MSDEQLDTLSPIRLGDGKHGWTLDYQQVLRIRELAGNMEEMEEEVSMEGTEAVMLAMIEAGFARVGK